MQFVGISEEKDITEWRNSTETAWLADAPVHPLQQTLKDLERAYTNFFAKRADFPRFNKKSQSDSFRYPDPKQINKTDQQNRSSSIMATTACFCQSWPGEADGSSPCSRDTSRTCPCCGHVSANNRKTQAH